VTLAGAYVQRGSGVRFRYTGRANAKPIYETFHGLTGKREIQRKLNAWVQEIESGEWHKRKARERIPATDTVSALLQQWLAAMRPPALRQLTWRRYESLVRVNILPVIGTVPLTELQSLHIQTVLDDMADKHLAARTRGHAYRAMSTGFQWAVIHDLLTVDPCRTGKVKAPRVEQREPEAPNPSDVHRILEEVEGAPYSVALLLAASAGLRRSEALGLRRSDLDLEAGTATIQVQAQLDGTEVALRKVKTDRGRRTVPLTPRTVAAIRRQLASQAETRLLVGERWQDTGVIVDRGDGRPVNPDILYPLRV
jgi:integrase